jgi:hypothetical protein
MIPIVTPVAEARRSGGLLPVQGHAAIERPKGGNGACRRAWSDDAASRPPWITSRAHMKFDPLTGRLWNDAGRFLKRLHCPVSIRPAQIRNGACLACSHTVVPLDDMRDAEVTALLSGNPDQCVTFDLNSENIEVVLDAPQP